MNEAKTTDIDAALKSASLKDFDKLSKEAIPDESLTLSAYFEKYMKENALERKDVIKRSQIPESYAYQVLNGTKPNPTRDRVIAICLAMHMSLDDANRALKLCDAGVLYSKRLRDALIIIAFNSGEFDVMKLNEKLVEHDMNCLETSKDK